MRKCLWIRALLVCLGSLVPVGAVVAQEEEIEEIVVLGLAERYGSGLSRAEFALGADDIDFARAAPKSPSRCPRFQEYRSPPAMPAAAVFRWSYICGD